MRTAALHSRAINRPCKHANGLRIVFANAPYSVKPSRPTGQSGLLVVCQGGLIRRRILRCIMTSHARRYAISLCFPNTLFPSLAILIRNFHYNVDKCDRPIQPRQKISRRQDTSKFIARAFSLMFQHSPRENTFCRDVMK